MSLRDKEQNTSGAASHFQNRAAGLLGKFEIEGKVDEVLLRRKAPS
jgi:hypothetical protein